MNDKQEKGAMQVDVALVRELAALLDDTHLTEIEVEDGERKIRVARQITQAAPIAYAPPAAAAPATGAPASAPDVEAAPAVSANAVKSPMVGTVYLQSEPGSPPFKAVGATVAEGDTVLIIEAMKVMNPIQAPRGGKLTKVLVENGQPVEFDQPLFVISNPTRLWVLLDVPEVLTREIQIGEEVRIAVPALPGELFSAKVDYVADFIDPQTRTVRARAVVDNRDRRLKAEMYITGDVEIPPSSALKVPSTAIYLLGDSYYAFVEESRGRFVRRALKAEEGTLGSMRVTSGLKADETVVADGALLLQQMLNQKATSPRKSAAADTK